MKKTLFSLLSVLLFTTPLNIVSAKELVCSRESRYYTGIGVKLMRVRDVELSELPQFPKAVKIFEVFANSPAAKEGIEINDTILAVNNVTFKTAEEFVSLIPKKLGAEIILSVIKADRVMKTESITRITLTIAEIDKLRKVKSENGQTSDIVFGKNIPIRFSSLSVEPPVQNGIVAWSRVDKNGEHGFVYTIAIRNDTKKTLYLGDDLIKRFSKTKNIKMPMGLAPGMVWTESNTDCNIPSIIGVFASVSTDKDVPNNVLLEIVGPSS